MKKSNFLNRMTTVTIMLTLFIGFNVLPVKVLSQTSSALFVVVDFMKVRPENHNKYLEVEQEIWKPMHQERIHQGIIVGWFLYAVQFSGTGDEYNYVVINLYDNAEKLENPWSQGILTTVHPGLTLSDIRERTGDSRETVRTQLFNSIATAPEIPLETPAPYLQVNYMNVEPGKATDYERLESDIWLPIHNESVRSGLTAGWGLWRSLFPRGAGEGYQYITLDSFSEFSYIFGLDFSVPFKAIHPEKDYADILQQTQEARTIVRTELWDLIDYAVK